jgi:hypothetical protein
MGDDDMIQTDFIVRAGVLFWRSADEAVVDEQFVVGVSAVGCEDFFANLCGPLVLMHPAILEVVAHLCCSCREPAARYRRDGESVEQRKNHDLP